MGLGPSWSQLLDGADHVASVNARRSAFTFAGGRTVPAEWNFRDTYKGEYTQEELPTAQTREAIVDELTYFNSGVWVGVDKAEAQADSAQS